MLIIVHSEEEKKQWLEASRYIHNLRYIDSEHNDAVNTIMHLYLAPYLIEVRPRTVNEVLASKEIAQG